MAFDIGPLPIWSPILDTADKSGARVFGWRKDSNRDKGSLQFYHWVRAVPKP